MANFRSPPGQTLPWARAGMGRALALESVFGNVEVVDAHELSLVVDIEKHPGIFCIHCRLAHMGPRSLGTSEQHSRRPD